MNTARMLLCVAFLSIASLLWAKDPDAFYYVKPKAVSQTAFAQKLTSLPEWDTFRALFCETVDKVANKGLTDKQNLEKALPSKLAEQLADNIESRGGVSVREVVDALAEHLEAIIVMADETEFQGFTGVVALIGDAHPAMGLVWLPLAEGIEEGKDYKFLKKDQNGDFILQADFYSKQLNRDIKLCCAGLKLPGSADRYALLFSNEVGIQKYYDAFKNGQTGEEYAKGYGKKVVVGDRCFRALEKKGKELGWPTRARETCGKIKAVELGCRDIDGATQIEIGLSLKQEDDAKMVRDLILGAGMFVQLAAAAREEAGADTKWGQQIADFLQTVKAEANGTDVVATVKLDSPDLWNLIAKGLTKASDELRQKKDYSSLRNEIREKLERAVKSIAP